MKPKPAPAENRRHTRHGCLPRSVLAGLAVVALALPSSGCTVFSRDPACHGFEVEDPLLEVRLFKLKEPLRSGAVTAAVDSLYLEVGHGGEAAMVHEPESRARLTSRCRSLAPDDLAEVVRAVERLERSVVAERRIERPGCRHLASIVLRGDDLLKKFSYCGATPPAPIVRFVEEISLPLGRRFGKELAAGLAATAPWVSGRPAAP